jgi:hypothetical protein
VRKPGCLRARLVCAVCVPALVVCASFVPVACFSTVPLLRSHLAAPTRCGVGASCVRAGGGRAGLCGRVCLRVAGFGVCAFWVCSRGCLRSCLCALAWGWWGVVCPAAPAPACLLACVLTLWRGLVGVCDAPLGAGVTVMGRDNHVPPHAVWRALPGCCVRVERERGLWAPARSGERNPSLVLAYVETGSRPVGAEQGGGASGRTVWSGWGRWFRFWW